MNKPRILPEYEGMIRMSGLPQDLPIVTDAPEGIDRFFMGDVLGSTVAYKNLLDNKDLSLTYLGKQ